MFRIMNLYYRKVKSLIFLPKICTRSIICLFWVTEGQLREMKIWSVQRWAVRDWNGQKSATLLPSSILHSSSTLQIMSITLPLSRVEECKSGRVITLPLFSIRKASAKASANSRRVEEWKVYHSSTLESGRVEDCHSSTLGVEEW